MELTAAQMLFAATATTAAASVYSGYQEQKMYDAKAAQAQLQGRARATQYRLQAARVMQNLNETLATTVARASVTQDPLSGSALSLQNYAVKEGAYEYGTAKDNAVLAISDADTQANIYKQAGKTAMITGVVKAAGAAGQGYYQALTLG